MKNLPPGARGARGGSALVALLVLGAALGGGALTSRAQTAPPPEDLPTPTPAASQSAKKRRAVGEQPTPPPASTPAAVAPPAPVAGPQTRPGQPSLSAPRAPRPGVPPRATPPAAPSAPVAPPPKVITVVHRLNGWKLLAWLSLSGPSMLELDRWPSPTDVHTNIVAGFVADDGRTVVARLPQAEAEVEALTPQPFPPGFFEQPFPPAPNLPELMLVRGDGAKIEAKFIGLDAATGLSLLEAAEPLITPAGDTGDTEETPTVGQRVRLFAPAPAPAPAAAPAAAAPAAGDEGVIYMSMGETEGLLTDVRKAATGKPLRATARSKRLSPVWTGAVATDESGALVGIVSQSGESETSIVTAEAMRAAIERVRTRRAAVPQPWLGARGGIVAKSAFNSLVEQGWDAAAVAPFVNKQVGVMLTYVAPGAPAALAGLRPGDIVERIGGREVRGVADLSLFLKEAGAGSTVDFTVWRAREPAPLNLTVTLSARHNPALATAEAEFRAFGMGSRFGESPPREALAEARAKLQSLLAEVRAARREVERLRAASTPGGAAPLATAETRLRSLEERAALLRARAAEDEARAAVAGRPGGEAPPRPGLLPSAGPLLKPLQGYGLHVLGLTPRSASRLAANGGLLVVSVRPESAAASAGLRSGDVVEAVNGQAVNGIGAARLFTLSGPGELNLSVVRERRRITVKLSPGETK